MTVKKYFKIITYRKTIQNHSIYENKFMNDVKQIKL